MDNDKALRPDNFTNYIGQSELIDNLKIYIKSAKIRSTTLDHILFTGPAGLGKTSLANVVANEMGVGIKTINGSMIKSKGELISVLVSLSKNDILFIDEIHALQDRVTEVLYTAMEDYSIDIPSDGDPVRLELEPFTLLGATTLAGLVPKPLLDRFGEVMKLVHYTNDEMALIIHRSFVRLQMECDLEACLELAKRTRGVPRIANRLVRRSVDFCVAEESSMISTALVDKVCRSLGIDKDGLDKPSRLYMTCVRKHDKALGLSTISSLISETVETIENNIEPYLIQKGFVVKTVKGRVITNEGKNYTDSL